jgi:hypothetical protein
MAAPFQKSRQFPADQSGAAGNDRFHPSTSSSLKISSYVQYTPHRKRNPFKGKGKQHLF